MVSKYHWRPDGRKTSILADLMTCIVIEMTGAFLQAIRPTKKDSIKNSSAPTTPIKYWTTCSKQRSCLSGTREKVYARSPTWATPISTTTLKHLNRLTITLETYLPYSKSLRATSKALARSVFLIR